MVLCCKEFIVPLFELVQSKIRKKLLITKATSPSSDDKLHLHAPVLGNQQTYITGPTPPELQT